MSSMRVPLLFVVALGFACTPAAEDTGPCERNEDCEERGYCLLGECHACDEGLPEPNDPCLPRCGNSLGVGMACSLAGGECNNNDIHALFCTIDQVPDADLHMCTGPCVEDSDCGEDAVCEGDPDDPDGPRGCVPTACVGG